MKIRGRFFEKFLHGAIAPGSLVAPAPTASSIRSASIGYAVVLLGCDVFGNYVKDRAWKISREPFENYRKQSGIHDDGRTNPQAASVWLLDGLDLLQAPAHFVKHRGSDLSSARP